MVLILRVFFLLNCMKTYHFGQKKNKEKNAPLPCFLAEIRTRNISFFFTSPLNYVFIQPAPGFWASHSTELQKLSVDGVIKCKFVI